MDKGTTQQPFETPTPNPDMTITEPASQQIHQHNSALHYYPLIHQHPQIYNKTHPHRAQSPLLLNIPTNQQMLQATAHRHFQHYPQYTVNSNEYSHQHVYRPPLQNNIALPQQNSNNQISTVQNNQYQVEMQAKPQQEDSQPKAPTPKPKFKEGERKQLRSPSARRPPNAPVAMQGWLHKQGSEGLMLWKKRWFVLSEYCLFYYKGSAEEKLLGSILLPSYKVSICGLEDKINRKFAFKCEHANMRTYILAADSQELMMQWVHVLNLACNLQNNVEPSFREQQNPDPNSLKPNAPAGQTVIYNSTQPGRNNPPVHTHTSSNTTDLSNSSQQELNQYNQPLYANAPPKPRRLTDGYCSPGPEILERYRNPMGVRSGAKSPSCTFGRHLNIPPTPQPDCMQIYSERVCVAPQNVDRRTPDTYGRSNLNKFRNPSDYEDIYADQSIYKRPLSPVAADNMMKKGYPQVNLSYKGYAPVDLLRPQYGPLQTRKPPIQLISRPHSADFLEYKRNKLESNPSVNPVSEQARPKSSLDINMYAKDCDMACKPNTYFVEINQRNRNDNDNYFYSQERYAEKMRKSAQYLQKMPLKHQSVDTSHRKHRERYDMEPPNAYNTYNHPFREPPNVSQMNPQPIRSRSALSEGSLLCAQDIENDSIKRGFPLCQDPSLGHSTRNVNQDQFTRSASARLSQSNQDGSNSEEKCVNIEGERKREESMKRLLEWKQRMLQSPLNRKARAQGYRGYPGEKENSYVYQNYSTEKQKQKKAAINTRRSAHSLIQYNSYSSDDEENGARSKTSMHSQAGRTVDTFPNNSDSLTHAHASSTTALKSPEMPVNDSKDDAVKTMSGDNVLVEPIENSELAELNYGEQFNDGTLVTDIKSSGALVKAILSEFQNPSKDTIIEGNYMPMSPKKSVLQSKSDTNSDTTVIFNESEENHYVEMTRSVDSSLLDASADGDVNDQQQYEMVCFKEGKSEPVYMEVPGLQGKENNQDAEGLPDILKSPAGHRNKEIQSDSSDADDEGSKGLDSLEHPNHQRFSLSDTFRPASYYLGVSKTIPEFQDSSDSELVSPPPIPTSSPPPDDDEFLMNIRTKDRSLNSSIHSRNSDQFFNSNNKRISPVKRVAPKTSFISLKDFKDQEGSFVYDLDYNDSLSRLSFNSDSITELQIPYSRRAFSEDLSSEYAKMEENRSGIRNVKREDGPAYENFVINKKTREETLSIDATNPSKKRLASPSPIPDFRPRGRPDSSCSVSAEVSSFLANSNRSTPVVTIDLSTSQLDVPQIVPYYYSDLSGNISSMECGNLSELTLNNQRESTNGNKKDITLIINPIKCDRQETNYFRDYQEDSSHTLAAEARSVSVDFLNLTDKSDNIDKKNIYESDTLKRQKAGDITDDHPDSRNFYLLGKSNKFRQTNLRSQKGVRKSYSLEGLLENVLNENVATESSMRGTSNNENTTSEGSYLWEEDSIWRDRLRTVSQRQSKSMDDLDRLDTELDATQKKSSRAITREVTYVNDILFKTSELVAKKSPKPSKTEIKKKGSFLIDRETLRQWDLLSSAPSDDQLLKVADTHASQGQGVVELGEGSCETGEKGQTQETASGSISINTRDATLQSDSFPRAMTAKRSATPNLQNLQARSVANLDSGYQYDKNCVNYPTCANQSQYIYGREEDFRSSQNELTPKNNVSAGELLGQTHEELVLMLIQLRRQQAHTFQAIESCYNEIDTLQICMHNMDQIKRMENVQKLERIKQNLLELEKQYEKRKPLVNLVDNMVKLGSLYRNPTERNDMARHIRERLEFNQHIQERRLLAEEKREWKMLEPSHLQLQEKVRQLYQLDGLIQEESRNLYNLQRDKEDIERALGGLRNRLVKGLNNPEEVEQARRQQFALENELSRVHLMLAQNSKKLEETVAGNARLEHELLVLKQKLQSSRQHRSSPQFSNAGDSLPYFGGSAVLETDLERVQKKIGDLQKQREELSLQVRQLTDRSNTPHSHQNKHPSPTENQTQCIKKKPTSFWRETDLDTMSSVDHGYDSYSSTSTTPLYINTDTKTLENADYSDRGLKTSDSTSEDTTLSSNPLEKQEIKTVRIVKRESERRQRDREKTFNGKCDPLTEEDDSSQNSSVLFRPTSLPQKLAYEHHSLPTRSQKQKPVELSPVFKSEAARQIITEVSKKGPTASGQRRTVPKEHRRHHTAPHNNLVVLGNLEERRARDDLDIERALRQRIDAPDIVRSTLSNKELKYNEETIDNILSTPNKILIPERYIPEQLPQPSVEEQEKRNKKVESIKKMLSDTAIISAPTSAQADDKGADNKPISNRKNAPHTSIMEEKKQREHLLQLNQILAKQVMEMSKVVAVKNLAKLQFVEQPVSTEEEDSSPITPLPLYQQRENFYS